MGIANPKILHIRKLHGSLSQGLILGWAEYDDTFRGSFIFRVRFLSHLIILICKLALLASVDSANLVLLKLSFFEEPKIAISIDNIKLQGMLLTCFILSRVFGEQAAITIMKSPSEWAPSPSVLVEGLLTIVGVKRGVRYLRRRTHQL